MRLTRKYWNIVAVAAVIIGFVLLAWVNMFGGRIVAANTLTVFVWAMWATIAVGYGVRLILSFTRKSRAKTASPIVSAGESVQDIYLGRVVTPAPTRQPDEYSAHGSASAGMGDDLLDRPGTGKGSSRP